MQVLIGAPLADFPAGTYGYYQGEVVYLSALVDVEPEATDDTDLLIQMWDGLDAALIERLRARAREVSGVWVSDEGDVWTTDAGLARIRDLFDEADADEIACYLFERSSGTSLFDAIDGLVYTPIVSMESAWGEVDPDDYGVDDETEEMLERVDDERVQDALRITLGSDHTVFEMWSTAPELASQSRGVHVVCDIEDQCQQDFVNRVLYIPPDGLSGG